MKRAAVRPLRVFTRRWSVSARSGAGGLAFYDEIQTCTVILTPIERFFRSVLRHSALGYQRPVRYHQEKISDPQRPSVPPLHELTAANVTHA